MGLAGHLAPVVHREPLDRRPAYVRQQVTQPQAIQFASKRVQPDMRHDGLT
jgi:hypothetical protein